MANQIIWKPRLYTEGLTWVNDGADCVIINNGAADVIVNGLVLSPQASITDTCFGNELNKTAYVVQFSGNGETSVIIKTKYYL